jgi:LuxR family maltose regulon positive regulatory protein
MMGLSHVWLAQLLYEWNDLEGATHHATEGIACVAAHHQHERILMEGYAVLARIRQAQGDARAALDLLQQCEQVAQRINMPWATARVRAYKAREWLALGLVEQASRWLQEAGLGPADELTSQREYEHTAMARVLLAQGNWSQALSTLAHVLEGARSNGRLQAVVEAGALRALAFQLAGWQEKALDSLRESVELATPEGYARTFIDLGESMRRLISNLRSQVGKQTSLVLYLDQIMATFPASPPAGKAMGITSADQPSIIHHLVEPLSPRELQVLRMVAQGLSNQEIAVRLVVALSTVKAHTNSIFGKMGVKSRTQAIARARELDLL